MSTTSYQTAPPRISIINNALDLVKPGSVIKSCWDALPQAGMKEDSGRDSAVNYARFSRRSHLSAYPSHPAAGSRHRKGRKFCRHENRDAVKENVIYGQERSERKSSHHRAREFERTASSSPACCSDSRVRYRFAPVASRPRRASSPGNDGTTQPLVSRHHDAARSL